MEGLGDNADQLAFRVRFWNLQTVLAHAFDMKLDGFLNENLNFRSGGAYRNAARKVGDIRAEACWAPLNDDKVLHENLTSSGQLASGYLRACRAAPQRSAYPQL